MNAVGTAFKFAAIFGPVAFKLGAKLVKTFKVVKVGMAAGSVASYAWLFTWEFALLLVAGLVVHEYGHVRAMKLCGVPTRGFYLIPFVGGAAIQDGETRSRFDDFVIAVAGPLFGLGSAVAAYAVYLATDAPIWAGAASFLALLNVFNLLPIHPLDGGKIVGSVMFSFSRVSGLIAALLLLFCGAVLAMAMGSWFLGIILVVGGVEIAFEWRKRSLTVPPMRQSTTLPVLLAYFALVGVFIGLMYAASHVPGADIALQALKDGGGE